MKDVVLVGELNPYGVEARYALYDMPVNSAGWRLRTKILQLKRTSYHKLIKHNLCVGVWDAAAASIRAQEILSQHSGAMFILLGRKVTIAFRLDAVPPFSAQGSFIVLPHPSGLCRDWNVEGAYDRAFTLIKTHCPHVQWGDVG